MTTSLKTSFWTKVQFRLKDFTSSEDVLTPGEKGWFSTYGVCITGGTWTLSSVCCFLFFVLTKEKWGSGQRP